MLVSRLSALTALLLFGGGVRLWSQGSWGPEGGLLHQQIADALQQARAGSRALTVGLLKGLAAEAQQSNELEAWAWAQTGIAEQVLQAEKEEKEFIDADPVRILDEMMRRCASANIVSPLPRALAAQAECLIQLGHHIPAAHAWERAGSLALDANQPERALTFFLCAARVYRNEGHAAKVRESQTWLDIIARDLRDELSPAGLASIEKFRASAANLLSLTQLPGGENSPDVAFQPVHSGVMVSSSENERGRCRFTLANHSTKAIEGLLTVSASQASVGSWQQEPGAATIVFRPDPKPSAEVRRLRILPGEKMKVFIDYRFTGGNVNFTDVLRLSWSDAQTSQDAEAQFQFAAGAAAKSQFTNASRMVQSTGWPMPFYHELYYRGEAVQAENILATTSSPSRVEIYNEDTGGLIAIDAEGDGRYDGPSDFLDHSASVTANGEAWPRLVVGPKNPVGSLEIYVFPLTKTDSTKLTLSLADYSSAPPRWRQDSVDEQLSSEVAP